MAGGCDSSGVMAAKLSSFYFCYFAFLGCLLPFWPLFLSERGFDGFQISTVYAVFLSTKIFAPSIAGYISDRYDYHINVIRFSLIAAGTAFSLYLLDFDFTSLVLIALVYSFFWNAILSQFEAYTLTVLAEKSDRYSQIRVWGSVGFIVLSLVLGLVFEWVTMAWLPLIMVSLIFLACFISWRLPETNLGSMNGGVRKIESIIPVLRQRSVISFLLVCFFIQLSHGAYYSFYSLYLKEYSYTSFWIGVLWSVGVVAEIILFMFFPRMLKRQGEYFLMVCSIALTVVRWVLIAAFPSNVLVVLFSQLLHAFSFGCLHVVSMVYVQRFFPSGFSGRGQALYSGVSFGLGGAMGAVASGFLWDSSLGHEAIFYFSAIAAFIGLYFSLRLKVL